MDESYYRDAGFSYQLYRVQKGTRKPVTDFLFPAFDFLQFCGLHCPATTRLTGSEDELRVQGRHQAMSLGVASTLLPEWHHRVQQPRHL